MRAAAFTSLLRQQHPRSSAMLLQAQWGGAREEQGRARAADAVGMGAAS